MDQIKEKLPDNLKYLGDIMSNFDHEIIEGAEEKLKKGNVYGHYPGWNFFATVWFDGKFKAMIKQYRSHVNTLENDSLQGIIDEACELYGSE